MSGMFYECKSLKEINLSSFKTDNVTNMSKMFNLCQSNLNLRCEDEKLKKEFNSRKIIEKLIKIIV